MRRSPDRGSSPLRYDILAAIQAYMDECLFEPASNWPPYWFEQRSYARWAAKEIMDAIEKNDSVPPAEVVEGFIKMVDGFTCDELKPDTIFSIAKDVANDILDIMNAAS